MTPVRVLLVSAAIEDATPLLDELRAEGFDPQCISVDSAQAAALLMTHAPDRPVVVYQRMSTTPLAMQIKLVELALKHHDVARAQELLAEMTQLLDP